MSSQSWGPEHHLRLPFSWTQRGLPQRLQATQPPSAQSGWQTFISWPLTGASPHRSGRRDPWSTQSLMETMRLLRGPGPGLMDITASQAKGPTHWQEQTSPSVCPLVPKAPKHVSLMLLLNKPFLQKAE